MTRKKVYALILCLALLIAAVLPGTLAVSNDTADSTGSFTLDDQQPVEETPTEDAPPADENAPADDAETSGDAEDAETPNNTDEPSVGADDPVRPDGCTCDFTDGQHSADCALYSAPDFDVWMVYDQLLACTTTAEMDEILNALTDEQYAQFTEEMLVAIDAHYTELAPVVHSDWIPAVNVTNVAPLLPPVSGRTVRRAQSRVSTYADDTTGSDAEGMHLSKTATVNSDGTYTITLEAYATGETVITTVEEDIPTDIVLVLDQSGSMADCINCGLDSQYWSNNPCNKYTEVGTAGTITPSSNTNYYYRNGNSYDQAYYCDGSDWGHNGHNGWYSSSWYHSNGNKLSSDETLYVSSRHQSRLDALKSAAATFVDAVAKKAAGKDGDIATTDDNVNHRIAVVGFASESGNGNNTELLSISGRNSGNVGIRYGNIETQDLINVVQSMDTAAGVNMVNSAINALAASGATEIDLGMDMANRILNANPVSAGEKRNRVVVVFTDGAPTSYNGFYINVAERAISTANTIKAGGTTVYSVGIFSGADATSAGTKPSDDLAQNSSQMTAACNWFMQNVSSNNGTPKSPSYYLSAGDSASLNSIFQQISSNIETGGTSSTLTEETVVKDIISPQFTLPEGATVADITLETYRCTGKEGSDYTWLNNENTMGASATIGSTDASADITTNNQVSVTGFDFSKNWCGTETDADGKITYRGNKLVIRFNVKPRAGFLGGNSVITNTSAGIYPDKDADQPVLTFDQPNVDVTIKEPSITLPDANVYLGAYFSETVDADELKDGTTVKFGDDVELDLSKPDDNWGLEDWQTEYVTIEVKITDADGNEVSEFDKLTDDTQYKVSVSIKPITPKENNNGYENDMTGTIHVFKPELTFKDSTAYYGESVPADNNYSGNRVGTETWKNGEKKSTDADVTMLGTKPTLDITYTPDASKIENGKYTKQDVPVSVTVKIGTDDVNAYTTFVHDTCTVDSCDWAEPTVKGSPAFLIHIKTCTLTVQKLGGAPDEPYVFTVYKVEDGVEQPYTEVTVEGNTSQTIYELPVGTYTIKENTGWSWRYTADNGGSAVLSADSPEGSITCTNTKTIDKWLNGFSTVVRNIFGQKH